MAQENVGLADIPEELLWNILIRLPTKLVVRCKLVSKQWASLISDPFFVSSYLSRFPLSSSRWTVVGERVKDRCIEYILPKYMCSRQNFDAIGLSTGHEREEHQRFKVLGASNGMILSGLIDCYWGIYYVSCNLYYICNPAIRKLIVLSPPTPDKVLAVEWVFGSGLVARVENDVLESFRVVLLWPDFETERLRFMVYASETREWNRYIVPRTVPTQDIANRLPTAFNLMLHWLTRDGSVIAYDPYTNPDRVRVIPPPKDKVACRRPSRQLYWLCGASEGKLSYLQRFCALTESYFRVWFKMWVLEDYGSGSWCMSHEWDSSRVRHNHGVVCLNVLATSVPMFFDRFDSDILYLRQYRDQYRLISYDSKTQKVEVVQEFTTGCATNKMLPRYFDFLVELLPWTDFMDPLL